MKTLDKVTIDFNDYDEVYGECVICGDEVSSDPWVIIILEGPEVYDRKIMCKYCLYLGPEDAAQEVIKLADRTRQYANYLENVFSLLVGSIPADEWQRARDAFEN